MPPTKRKLVEAAIRLMMRQGYTATTVDQVCSQAGLTKGSFFHYFENKEAIGRAAMEFFSCCQSEAFAAGALDRVDDPVERIHALFDLMERMIGDPTHPGVCLVGMMAQELAASNETMRGCCEQHLGGWTTMVAGMLAEAKQARVPESAFDPESVAWLLTSMVQGSMLVAKTRQDRGVILNNIRHCRAYVDSLLGVTPG